MIDELKQNIKTEIEVLREISNNTRMMDYASAPERKLLEASIESLRASLKIINNSIPKLLEEITLAKKLPQAAKATKLEKIEFKTTGPVLKVTLKTEDRESFLKQLSINENLLKKIKRKHFVQEEKPEEMKGARGYLKMSNKFFLNTALKMIAKGNFKPLSIEIRKANIGMLFSGYVAMMFFSTFLAFIFGIILTIFLFFFDLTLVFPFIKIQEAISFAEILKIFWMPFALPIVTFLVLYYYPSQEKDSLAKKIEQELPFAVIHMSAISGSGIEPTEIFKIIGLNKEYPYLRKEIRKLLNQINLYGYDLVNALNNVARITPSQKLAELFAGLSTTITSGGNLGEFFSKRAETLLISYRLEREKYTKIAETFMDIYISIVIAAPMILMILLVMISISNIQVGYTTQELTLIIIGIISLINIVFLAFLHFKQPSY